MERPTRVGVIGTGWWADLEHLPGLRSRPDVEVVALCGRDLGRAKALAGKHHVTNVYTDWQEMIARAEMDALVICTPNVLHRPQALAALSRGLHVICEKPLAMNLAEAREMVAAARVARCRTLTFFTHRTIAAATYIKQLIENGFLGNPSLVIAQYFSASHLDPNRPIVWRMLKDQAGSGALGDIGSHVIDLVRWWLGDFARVCGTLRTFVSDRPRAVGAVERAAVTADDAAVFQADLACGAQAVFMASKTAAGRSNYQRVELHGSRGSLIYETEPGFDPTWEGRVYAGWAGAFGVNPLAIPAELSAGLATEDPQANRNEAFRRLTDPFFAAVRGQAGIEVRPDFVDGAAVQAVLDAVSEASASRGWVDVAAAV